MKHWNRRISRQDVSIIYITYRSTRWPTKHIIYKLCHYVSTIGIINNSNTVYLVKCSNSNFFNLKLSIPWTFSSVLRISYLNNEKIGYNSNIFVNNSFFLILIFSTRDKNVLNLSSPQLHKHKYIIMNWDDLLKTNHKS